MTRVRLVVDLKHDDIVTPQDLHGMAIDALAGVCHVENDHGITVLDAPGAEPTWTFCGHWNNAGQLVVEYALPGDQQDQREDRGHHSGGLWAAAASGRTEAIAQAGAVAEYQENDDPHRHTKDTVEHLCDEECGDPTHPHDDLRVLPLPTADADIAAHLASEHGYFDADNIPVGEHAEVHAVFHQGDAPESTEDSP